MRGTSCANTEILYQVRAWIIGRSPKKEAIKYIVLERQNQTAEGGLNGGRVGIENRGNAGNIGKNN